MGQQQTSRLFEGMSALPPIADIDLAGTGKSIFKIAAVRTHPQNFFHGRSAPLHSRVRPGVQEFEHTRCGFGREFVGIIVGILDCIDLNYFNESVRYIVSEVPLLHQSHPRQFADF